MSKPAEPLRQLARLASVPDRGGCNIGSHIKQHAAALARARDMPERDILAAALEPDEILAPKVQAALGRLRGSRQAAQLAHGAARAVEAARLVHERSRWQDGAVLVDPGLVLGDLPRDRLRSHLVFALHDGTEVAVRSRDLVATARVLGHRPDLVTFVDPAGVHVRWSGGRGGLNWYPRALTPAELEKAVRVVLSGPAPLPNPSAPRPRRRSWTWDLMADLGLAT